MKAILITLGVLGTIFVVLVGFVAIKFSGAVDKAHGQALYASVGAWTRTREFAEAKKNAKYLAEADEKLSLLKHDLEVWKEGAPTGTDFGELERLQKEAYEKTDRSIKEGQNPLEYLDRL